jgi:hypothetical protein
MPYLESSYFCGQTIILKYSFKMSWREIKHFERFKRQLLNCLCERHREMDKLDVKGSSCSIQSAKNKNDRKPIDHAN